MVANDYASKAQQTATANVVTKFQNNCNIQCTPITEDVNIKISGTVIGGIDFNQTCSMNAQCVSYNLIQNQILQDLSQALQATQGGGLTGNSATSTSGENTGVNIDNEVTNTCNVINTETIK